MARPACAGGLLAVCGIAGTAVPGAVGATTDRAVELDPGAAVRAALGASDDRAAALEGVTVARAPLAQARPNPGRPPSRRAGPTVFGGTGAVQRAPGLGADGVVPLPVWRRTATGIAAAAAERRAAERAAAATLARATEEVRSAETRLAAARSPAQRQSTEVRGEERAGRARSSGSDPRATRRDGEPQ
jgi:hypothetical protein